MINKVLFQEKTATSSKGLFVDRDGVINVKPADHDYVKDWKEFIFVDGIKDLLRQASQNGYQIIIVTNQRGISRGLITPSSFEKITQEMEAEFKQAGVQITAVYYCPHGEPDACDCRKPLPGLIKEALADFNLDPQKSILIGDSHTDIEAGHAAGLGTLILVETNSQKILNLI